MSKLKKIKLDESNQNGLWDRIDWSERLLLLTFIYLFVGWIAYTFFMIVVGIRDFQAYFVSVSLAIVFMGLIIFAGGNSVGVDK